MGLYRWNRDRCYPWVVTIDMLTRLMAARLLNSVDGRDIIVYFLDGRAQWIGPPKKLLVDAGRVVGQLFPASAQTYGCDIVSAPEGAPFQVGNVERIIQSLNLNAPYKTCTSRRCA